MGKKYLKNQNKKLVINIIDILADMDPSETNKFLPLLVKSFKPKQIEFKNYVISEISHLIGIENLKALEEFNFHLENKRTRLKDVSQLTDFSDVHEELVYAELNLKKTDLKKEVKVIYKDDEWLIIKPLSYESSKIYGAGTKWCTSSREEDKPFYRYSNDGILLYINKLGTKEKFAVFWVLDKNESSEMSWWDVEDRRVDSLTLKVPPKITQIVLDHYLSHKKTNSFYFKEKDKKRSLELFENNVRNMYFDDGVIPLPNIDFGLNADIYEGQRRTDTVDTPPTEPSWTVHEGNTTTTLNIDGLVNKTLEYSYMTEVMKKTLEDLED